VIEDASVSNDKVFYTDSNGLLIERRVRGERKRQSFDYDRHDAKIASNYYPVTSFIYIESQNDPKKRLLLFNDRSQGNLFENWQV
jgi:hypothetical protein